MAAGPRFTIKALPFEPAPVGGIKIHYSNFSFMFNTNWRPATMEEARASAAELEAAATATFAQDNFKHYIRFVNLHNGKELGPDPSADFDRDIRRISVKYQPELGPNKKLGARMHMHGIIKIAHDKYIRLSYDEILKTFNENMGESPHPIKNSHWKVEKTSLGQYMRKYGKRPLNFTLDTGRAASPTGEFTVEKFRGTAAEDVDNPHEPVVMDNNFSNKPS
jgi:hypothetical protein